MAPYLGQVAPWLIPPTTIEYITFSSAMPLEFVNATIDDMPVDASGRRVRPVKKPALIDTTNAITIVQHCAVFGTLRTIVREFKVTNLASYAQYPIAVRLAFVEPRKRQWASLRRSTPVNLRFATVERDGQVLYDSRKTAAMRHGGVDQTYRKQRERWLARQEEIDVAATPGVHTEQMGNFRDEDPYVA